MNEAKLKGANGKGLELRYAHRREQCWPGWDEELGLVGYWLGDGDDIEHIGRSVNWKALHKRGVKPVDADGKEKTEARGAGFNRLKDEDGRPLQVRRYVRNRITPTRGGGRLTYKRTIRNVVWTDGRAEWLLESIPISFKALGYCKFPGEHSAGMVALEVMGDKEVGWVRIDPYSITYKESNQ